MPIFIGIHFKEDVSSDTLALIDEAFVTHPDLARAHSSHVFCFALNTPTSIKRALSVYNQLASVKAQATIALHVGKAQHCGHTYIGPTVEHVQCIAESGWPGQILLSKDFLSVQPLPPDAEAEDLRWHRLRDLTPAEQISQLVHPQLEKKTFPPLRTLSSIPHNLPSQSRYFIGRRKERRELGARLRASSDRIITLKGPGGIGKTRLALQVAAETALHFPDGVYFVPLASLDAPEQLLSRMIDALDIEVNGRRKPEDVLLARLRRKRMLLVLDTFEHILPASPLLTKLLDVAPELRLLITSREALRLSEELVYPVRGLQCPPNHGDSSAPRASDPTPPHAYDGVQLFVQAARRVSPLFTLSKKNSASVIDLCHRLAGMPLGIELAASAIYVFSAQELADRIAHDMGALTTHRRDIQPRHRSLRVVFEHSWRLLSAEEQEILTRLTVFHSGFREEAALAVVDASPAILASLQEKSLLSKSTDGRFSMLQPVHHFAAGKLSLESESWRLLKDRHAAYYTDLVAEYTPYLWTERQHAMMRELSPELKNIREAWRWAVRQGQVSAVENSLEFMYRFYQVRGYLKEGEDLFRSARETLECEVSERTTPEVRGALAKLLECEAMFTFSLSKLEAAREKLNESLVVFKELNLRHYEGFALMGLGRIAYEYGQLDTAKTHFKQGHLILEAVGDRSSAARAVYQLGNVHYASGRYQEALSYYRKSMDMHEVLGDHLGIADCLYSIGRVESILGYFTEAKDTLKQSKDIYRDLGEKSGLSAVEIELGIIVIVEGHFQEGRTHFEEALALCQPLGDPALMAEAIIYLAGVCSYLGDAERGEKLVQKALELRSHYEQPAVQGFTSLLLGLFQLSVGDLESALASFQEAIDIMTAIGYQRERMLVQGYLIAVLIEDGQLATAEQLCHENLEYIELSGARQFLGDTLNGLGMLAIAEHSKEQAKKYFRRAIEVGFKMGALPSVLTAVRYLISHRIIQIDPETALAWLTLIMYHPASDVYQKYTAQQAFDQFAEYLPAERVEAAQARGQHLSLDGVVTHILSDRREPCLK